jgi:hypothetical protein
MPASKRLQPDAPRRRSGSRMADPLSMATRLVRRSRASRRQADLQRTLDAARSGAQGLTEPARIAAALENDSVEQLLVTRRFMERTDDIAKRLMHLATVRDMKTVVIDGVAALELDLFSEGVASRLRAG